MTQPTPDPLSQATELLRAGQEEEARSLIAAVLRENPNSAKGWWLMSYAIDDPDQQISCLKRVLRLHPNHSKAKARLATLTGEALPKSQEKPQKRKTSLSLPAILLLLVFGCVGFAVVGYFGYRIFFPSPTTQPTQVVVAQDPAPTATLMSTYELPATWTSTPASQPSATITKTPLPKATSTPLISITASPDPNATQTPIPEHLIGLGNGQYPPDFTLENAVTNQEISLSDYTEHPKIVVFLATWCGYCGQEMPGLQSVYEKYQDEGLVVLGIGVGASKSALRNYASQYGLTFPLLSDWEHDIARDYGARSIPMNYVIRKNGKIWQVSVGMMTEEELDLAVASVLKVP